MMTFLDGVIVVAATVLGAVMTVPQAVRLLRSGKVDGVSVTWAALSLLMNGWWVIYGMAAGSWAIVPVALISCGGYLVILGALAVNGHLGWLSATSRVWLASVGSAPLMALTLSGWEGVGFVLGAAYAVQLAPAVASVRRSRDLAGISSATWIIAAAEAALWGVHGITNADVGLIALGIAGVVMSSAVLVQLRLAEPSSRLVGQADSRFA